MAEARRRRRENPKVRRAQILDAAARSFRECGLQGTTVDKIASEAAVSVGLLYRFFASKSAIVEAIVTRDIERQLSQAAELLERASRHPERLPQLVSDQLAKSRIDRGSFALQFEIAAEVCRNEELRIHIRKKRAELVESLCTSFPDWGDGPSSIERTLESLDLTGAVASGLAMKAAIYSDSVHLSDDLLPELVETIFSHSNPVSE